MKFNSLQHTGVESLHIGSFNGGVNMYDRPGNIADNQLSSCLNVWNNGGLLKTRPGLFAVANDIITENLGPSYEQYNYFLTDSEVYIGGEPRRVAVSQVTKWDAHHYCYISFVGADGSRTDAGNIIFYRLIDNVFYKPSNILFFSAAPVNGGGVFAFFTLRNQYDFSDVYNMVYEINADMQGWTYVTSFYVPTVYINGRGTRYEEAKATNQAYTGAPMALEAPNLLGGRFHAYYTSDGFSGRFRLPFSGISSESVICRVYHTLNSYVQWTIPEGASSATATLFSAQVTLTVDREKGYIYFQDNEGDYPLPMMSQYHENNIKVTASKVTESGLSDIVSSSCCTALDSKIVFSGGNNPNTAYCVDALRPLYFPQNGELVIGNNNQAVTALMTQGNTVLAYKKNEIYTVKIKQGSAINSNSLLADNDAVFYKSDSFEVGVVNDKIGCENRKTLGKCGNRAVWLGSDGDIYTLTSLSGGEISKISTPAEPFLRQFSAEQLRSAFSACKNGHYLLMIGEKAIIMEYTQKELKCPKTQAGISSSEGIRWYIWSFPDSIDIIGGLSGSESIRLACVGSDSKVFYTAALDGNSDTEIHIDDTETVFQQSGIFSSITTKEFDFGHRESRKRIENVFLALSGRGSVGVKICGRDYDTVPVNASNEEFETGIQKNIRISAFREPTESVYITLSSENGIALSEMTLYYRKMN